jgi:hypothetical protein
MTTLRVSGEAMALLEGHFAKRPDEQLAFFAATWSGGEGVAEKLHLVPSSALKIQSPWHLELRDSERARVIRWAHDLGAGLVEAHVHRLPDPAEFSFSDLSGLAAFVPHVRWRLAKRPYVALVLGPRTFDALVWTGESAEPAPLQALVVGRVERLPTGRTLLQTGGRHGEPG